MLLESTPRRFCSSVLVTTVSVVCLSVFASTNELHRQLDLHQLNAITFHPANLNLESITSIYLPHYTVYPSDSLAMMPVSVASSSQVRLELLQIDFAFSGHLRNCTFFGFHPLALPQDKRNITPLLLTLRVVFHSHQLTLT